VTGLVIAALVGTLGFWSIHRPHAFAAYTKSLDVFALMLVRMMGRRATGCTIASWNSAEQLLARRFSCLL
jgi:hypothetical protein